MSMIKHFADSGKGEIWPPKHLYNDKVYILQWAATGKIDSVYLIKEKAVRIADKTNKELTWKHKLAGLISGKLCKWVVVEYEVQ